MLQGLGVLTERFGLFRLLMGSPQSVKVRGGGLRDFIYIYLLLIAILNLFSHPVKVIEVKAQELKTEVIYVSPDTRAINLESFLVHHSSPLSPYSAYIVAEADRYGIDYTQVVAISAIESDYGKRIPEGSFNAWGLGGSNFMHFGSWEESITYTTMLLSSKYRLSQINAVKTRYCPAPSCNSHWSHIVLSATNDILAYNEQKAEKDN